MVVAIGRLLAEVVRGVGVGGYEMVVLGDVQVWSTLVMVEEFWGFAKTLVRGGNQYRRIWRNSNMEKGEWECPNGLTKLSRIEIWAIIAFFLSLYPQTKQPLREGERERENT